jgi:proteasome lid subunit RPN8/RPN11
MKPIILTEQLWIETWNGLHERGQEQHESVCIFWGQREKERDIAKGVIFLDDLPGVQAKAAHYQCMRPTTDAMFEILRERGAQIVADIHTHPGRWVDLSWIDKRNPLEYRRGLIAIVIPEFAKGTPRRTGIGVHEYLGDGEWLRYSPKQIKKTLIFEVQS